MNYKFVDFQTSGKSLLSIHTAVLVCTWQWDFSLLPVGNTFTEADKALDKPPLRRWHFLYERVTSSVRENFPSQNSNKYPKKHGSGLWRRQNSILDLRGTEDSSGVARSPSAQGSPSPTCAHWQLTQCVLLSGTRKQGAFSRFLFPNAVLFKNLK